VGHSPRQSADLGRPRKALERLLNLVGHFLYSRHFLLLGCFSILSALITRLPLAIDLSVSFAVYGALHASALVLTLRAPQPIRRKCLFVLIAAGLCVITFRAGILGRQLFATLTGNLGLYTALGLATITGALMYGVLIRLCGIFPFTLASLSAISLGCMSATFLALFTAGPLHFPGPWWLAVLWWHAFSGGLWYFERHGRAARERHPRWR
jgi:hypothetical protein